MNKKTWIIFGVICVAIFGGLIYISKKNQTSIDVSNVDTNAIQSAKPENGNIADHTTGSTNAKVRIIEYGDVQCPACGGAHPGLKQIIADYGDKINFVFRNFPLTTLHPNALAAATAVEAAGLQGKYWDMNNLLYESQSAWSNSDANQRTDQFVGYAKQLGLDTTKFKNDLGSQNIVKKISYDQALGRKLNVTGTPTIYLNGQKLDDDTVSGLVQGNPKALRDLIDGKLKENGVTPPQS